MEVKGLTVGELKSQLSNYPDDMLVVIDARNQDLNETVLLLTEGFLSPSTPYDGLFIDEHDPENLETIPAVGLYTSHLNVMEWNRENPGKAKWVSGSGEKQAKDG